uniref:Uncharacterized protein n=1 Tax=Trichuris muris TaxID=70415 RepID=A0A5S6QCK4_TRIMR
MCALEKHWNDNMIRSHKLFAMDNGSWSSVEAPMFADTFSGSAAGLSDSWFDRFGTQTIAADDHQPTPPSSKEPGSTVVNRFGSPASGLRMPSAKKLTTPKPFRFLSASPCAIRGPVREKQVAKKWTAANSISRGHSNPLHKHQQRSGALEGYKVPLTKDELNRAMKGAGLAQATQALSNKARSNERLKEQCIVVRSASTCSGRVQAVYGPKERSLNKKSQSDDVLKRVCQNADQKKNVGSQVLPPVSHAQKVPHLSTRPPLPIYSKQRKGTQESVGKGQEKMKSGSRSASRGTGVTVVKPFSFETENRHQRHLKLMEEKGAVGDGSVQEKQVAKKWTAANSIPRAHSNPLHKHAQRSGAMEGYKVPLTKDELNRAMKGAGLAQATQALSNKARSNERLKEQCIVVRSASTCSGRVQAVYGPKERSVNKKIQSDDVLKRVCQNADKKKNVGSQVLPPESHAHEVPHLSRPPLPIDSKQRKGTQESVGKGQEKMKSGSRSASRGTGVTVVKPFSFETEKRHQRHLKLMEEKGTVGDGSVREKQVAKKWTAANSIPRGDSNPLHKHEQRSGALEGYKVPLKKDELNRAMKGAGLAQATQALSSKARSNERLKEQCIVVRSASTCSGRVQAVYGPKERSVNKKSQSDDVLKRVCQNADKKKNVGSQVLPPESHAQEVPHLSRPPLPIDSKQRKGIQEGVDKGPAYLE